MGTSLLDPRACIIVHLLLWTPTQNWKLVELTNIVRGTSTKSNIYYKALIRVYRRGDAIFGWATISRRIYGAHQRMYIAQYTRLSSSLADIIDPSGKSDT